jgi:Resolvase, N terminal domain
MTSFLADETVPLRPAAYIRYRDAASEEESGMTAQRDTMIRLAEQEGWPAPAVYADTGESRPQLAALCDAIAAGRHDGVFLSHVRVVGRDLAEIEAFDRFCRQHGAQIRLPWGRRMTDASVVFDAIANPRHFAITDEHLRLLRRACVMWFDAEFGAPAIDPKRPYGNSIVYADMAEILRSPWSPESSAPAVTCATTNMTTAAGDATGPEAHAIRWRPAEDGMLVP